MNSGLQNYPYAIPYSQGSMPPSPMGEGTMYPPQGQPYVPQTQQQFPQYGGFNPPLPPSYGQPQQPQFPQQPQQPTIPQQPIEFEQSYIENILRLNRGKLATFYMTYTDSNEWRDRTYKGVIEAAGRDHIIISDPRDGKRYLLLNVYLAWVEFTEEINYEYPIR